MTPRRRKKPDPLAESLTQRLTALAGIFIASSHLTTHISNLQAHDWDIIFLTLLLLFMIFGDRIKRLFV